MYAIYYIFYIIIRNFNFGRLYSGYILILPNRKQLHLHSKNHKFSTNGTQISFRLQLFPCVYDFKLPPRSRWETALLWIITQQIVVISCRRFGTTYRSNLQGSRIQKLSCLLKIGPIHYPETSLRNYHYLLRNIREERCSHFIICPKILKMGGLHTAYSQVWMTWTNSRNFNTNFRQAFCFFFCFFLLLLFIQSY